MAETGNDCAREKSLDLLHSVLPEPAWMAFRDNGIVEYTGKCGIYTISAGDQTVIRDSRTGRTIAYACLQLSVLAPAYDRMAAEYLLLKNAEDLYWKTANIFDNPYEHLAEVLLIIFDSALMFYLVVLLV